MASGADTRTHTHAYRHADQSNFKKPGARGQRPHAPGLKIICMHCYTFLSDESMFTRFPFDVIVIIIIIVVDYYSSLTDERLVLDSELSTCCFCYAVI